MESLLIQFLVPPAALAALMAALYYIYPSPLIHGYNKFGGYLLAGLCRKYLRVNNISYCYYERESSSPSRTLLFLHGWTGSKIMWTQMVRHLPQDWRLILLDLPGHGESSFDSTATYGATGFADKIHEFVKAKELGPINIVGCSLGALITAAYASLYPDDVDTITLMCPPGAHKFPQGVKTEFLKTLEAGRNMVMPKNGTEFQEMIDMVLYNPAKFTFHNRMREALVEAQSHNYPHFAKIGEDLLELDKQEDTEKIKKMAGLIRARVLLLWGKDDKVCHPSGTHILGPLFTNCETVTLEHCGHAMAMDRPRKCASLISNFIS